MTQETPDTQPTEPPLHEQEAARLANLEAARALGVNPYGVRTDGLVSLAAARAAYDEAADAEHQAAAKSEAPVDNRPRVTVAGRVMLRRESGKLIWMNLRDGSGEDLQVAVSKRDCAEPGFDIAAVTDLGDILVCGGPVMRTKSGEVTIWASSVQAASKSLLPPPGKHAGLQDVELRYRQRYVDLWANPETARVFQLRSAIISHIRSLMEARGFLEVETPMLQALPGGAAARPFRTHLNALDMDVYMRIAPELYLKRLLVGGLPRVYEINRNFRNEGVDKQHNPEFTMLEAYQAFGDMGTMIELTEHLCRESARLVQASAHDLWRELRFAKVPFGQYAGETWDRVAATNPTYITEFLASSEDTYGIVKSAVWAFCAIQAELELPFGKLRVDYKSPFRRVSYMDLFNEAKKTASPEELLVILAAERGNPLVLNKMFEQIAEPTLDPARPTYITDYPSAISPLTRPKPSDPELADRADLFIGHMELAPHYTELNDPAVQAEKFRQQLAGIDDEESTFRNFDEDFIRALKVGMPPAGGMGLGIDRLVMLLTNQRSIRDVLLFPFMRPE